MLSTRAIGTALVAIPLAPVPARADTLLIPFFGVNFGGDSGKEFSEAFDTSQFNGGVSRPYGLVGTGLLKSTSDFGTGAAEIDESDLTWSAGGGVLLFFGTRAGLRFDVRYFKTFDDLEILGVPVAQSPGKIDFTRTSLGFVLRF